VDRFSLPDVITLVNISLNLCGVKTDANKTISINPRFLLFQPTLTEFYTLSTIPVVTVISDKKREYDISERENRKKLILWRGITPVWQCFQIQLNFNNTFWRSTRFTFEHHTVFINLKNDFITGTIFFLEGGRNNSVTR
jgi:hypothetical protein